MKKVMVLVLFLILAGCGMKYLAVDSSKLWKNIDMEKSVPTSYSDEINSGYTKKLEDSLGKVFNKEDGTKIYLFGGTPKMWKPFALVEEEGAYTILDWDNWISIVDSNRTYPAEEEIYSFDELKAFVKNLSRDGDLDDSSYANERVKKKLAEISIILIIASCAIVIIVKGVVNYNKKKTWKVGRDCLRNGWKVQ